MDRIIWSMVFVMSFLVTGGERAMACGVGEKEGKTFRFYEQDGRCLLRMPVGMLGREFLVVSRMDSTRGNKTYQKGWKVTEERVISFRLEDGRVGVYTPNYETGKIGMDEEMARLMQKTRPDVAAYSLDVVEKDGEWVTVDMTDIVEGGNLLTESVGGGVRLSGGSAQFSCTAERKLPAVYTLWVSEKTQMAQFPVTTTFVLLSEKPWEKRLADRRVGYAVSSYRTFAHVNEGVRTMRMVKRWKLEPKDEECYWRGELTEPAQPIVFYLDPNVPAHWKPYFVRAVEDWNVAFEKAGFRNAVVAREIPEDYVGAYSSLPGLILYQDSLKQEVVDLNIDPRSGEIVRACVHWSPQIIDSVKREWALRSAVWNGGNVSEEELEGEIVRATLGRRIGLALGLVNNQIAGTSVPVEKLRDNEWLSRHGMSPSLMTSVAMNTVAQEGDGVSLENLFGRVGVYDCWAIDWGYRYWPSDMVPQEMKEWLLGHVKDAACRWYNEQYDENPLRPLASMDRLGDDPIEAAVLAWRNVEALFAEGSLSGAHVRKEWVAQIGGKDGVLNLILKPVLRQIGGIEFHVADGRENRGRIHVVGEELRSVLEPVIRQIEGENESAMDEKGEYVRRLWVAARDRQEQAVSFVVEKVFGASSWLSQSPLAKEAGVNVKEMVVDGLWANALKCLSGEVCGRMALGMALEQNGPRWYSLCDMLTDMTDNVWPYMLKTAETDSVGRLLCEKYIEFLGTASASYQNDVRVAARICLESLNTCLQEERKRERDARRKLQLESYISKIEDVVKL